MSQAQSQTQAPMSLSLDDLRARWNAMADPYSQYLEPMSMSLSRALIQAIGIHHRLDKQLEQHNPVRAQSFSILECACGSGMASLELAQLLNDKDLYVVTDLSEAFLAKAQARMSPFLAANPSLSVRFETANSMALTYPNESFDCVFASLCLNLVPDADPMISEAARVLKPGGRAGWSVWGRQEHSPVFTLVPKVLKSMNMDPDIIFRSDAKESSAPTRSNFHLGSDVQSMRERVLRGGFKQAIVWHQPVVMDAFTGAEFAHRMLSGNVVYARMMDKLEPEVAAKLKAGVAAEADAILAQGRPICYDAMVIIGIK